jgi:hypothetical protein
MKPTLTCLLILLTCGSPVAANELLTTAPDAALTLARDRRDERGSLAHRYVCIVPGNRNTGDRGKTCTTYFGPAGSSCRCQNASGNGRVQRVN